MKLTFCLAAILTACSSAALAVTITIDAEMLKDQFGASMQQSGLVVLTAATDGSFNGPSVGHLVTGDEMLLYSWDLSAFAAAGVLSDITPDLSFSGAWDVGDPLRLYWYPDLTLLSDIPTAGMSYGYYSDSNPLGTDGSAPWITPEESDTISLRFFTSDASFLNTGGSNSAAAGEAGQVVPDGFTAVPEPGNVLGLCALLASAMHVRHRRPRQSTAN